MMSSIEQHFRSRSATALMALENRLDRILIWWLLLAGCACAARVALSPHPQGAAGIPTFLTYMLVVVAPFASTLLALRWFRDGHLQAPQAADDLGERDLILGVVAISVAGVDLAGLEQPDFVVVAQRLDAQMRRPGEVSDADFRSHAKQYRLSPWGRVNSAAGA